MRDDVRERALAELAGTEAAVFRFGQQVRAFLDAFPENVPEPLSVLPRYSNSTDSNGEFIAGGGSYLHLVVRTAGEVNEWARLLGSAVTQGVTATESYTNVGTKTDAVSDGLPVHVGASETYSPTEWQQMQDSSAELGGAA